MGQGDPTQNGKGDFYGVRMNKNVVVFNDPKIYTKTTKLIQQAALHQVRPSAPDGLDPNGESRHLFDRLSAQMLSPEPQGNQQPIQQQLGDQQTGPGVRRRRP